MVRIVATMKSPQLKLEDTLCSRVRLRILKLLVESKKLTTSEIAAKVGVNYVIARAHLNALEKGDVLTHANFGRRIRYYRFKESTRALAVKNFIEAWR
jgi:predicted ArsR family transcriptional regulator